MKRKAALAAVAVAVLWAAWHYHRLVFQDDEKRIKEIVGEMARAAEARDANALIDFFDGDYKDSDGNSKFIVYQMVSRALASVEEVKADVRDVDVFVTGDTAWATVTVYAQARRGGQMLDLFGSDSAPEAPRLAFKRTATGDFRVTSVENVRRGPGSGF